MSRPDSDVKQANQSSPRRSTASRVVRVVTGVVVCIALLFLPAGRLDWLEGWAFLVFYLAYVLALWAWVLRNDPELMRERTGVAENVENWDKAIIRVHTVLVIAMVSIASLDAGRFRWSSTPPGLRILGWLGLVAAGALGWWTMSANTYLSSMVRIQHDRGHRVVTSGPYQYVRHPMYVGTILFALGVPVVLGSWWALIPGGLIAILFVIRTALEDRMLRDQLSGYKEYAEGVRHRLLPGIW